MSDIKHSLVMDLPFSVRFKNCIQNTYGWNITYDELLNKSDAELLRIASFGRKSLNELNLFKNSQDPIAEFGNSYNKNKYKRHKSAAKALREIEKIRRYIYLLNQQVNAFHLTIDELMHIGDEK